MVAKKEVSIKIDYADKHVIVTNPFGSVVFDLGEYPETTVTRLALLGLKVEAKRATDYVALEAQLHSGNFETKKRGRAAGAKPRKPTYGLTLSRPCSAPLRRSDMRRSRLKKPRRWRAISRRLSCVATNAMWT